MLLADIDNGYGMSGSGLFLSKNGRLTGLMHVFNVIGLIKKKMGSKSEDGGTRVLVPFVPRYFISLAQIKTFLEQNNVPYLTGD